MSYVFEKANGERVAGCDAHYQSMRLRSTLLVLIATANQTIYTSVKGKNNV